MNNISVENRIKEVRISVGLNQLEFGLKLGVSVGVISNIELHRNKNDISKSPICNLICSVFNVNPNWLLTGDGEMFVPNNTTSLQSLKEEYNLSDYESEIIENFLSLSPDDRNTFLKLAKKLIPHE